MLAIIRVPLELWLIIMLVTLVTGFARWYAWWRATSDEHGSLAHELSKSLLGTEDDPYHQSQERVAPPDLIERADGWASRHELPPAGYSYARAGVASNGHPAWVVEDNSNGARWATTDDPGRPSQSDDPKATWIVPLDDVARGVARVGCAVSDEDIAFQFPAAAGLIRPTAYPDGHPRWVEPLSWEEISQVRSLARVLAGDVAGGSALAHAARLGELVDDPEKLNCVKDSYEWEEIERALDMIAARATDAKRTIQSAGASSPIAGLDGVDFAHDYVEAADQCFAVFSTTVSGWRSARQTVQRQ